MCVSLPHLCTTRVNIKSANYRTSNLVAIIQLFQRLFSDNPPVRSVSTTQQRQAAPPLPPRPTGTSSPTTTSTSPPSTPISPNRPPPPPPRPPALLSQPQLQLDTNGVSRSRSSSSLDQLSRSPPIHLKSPPPLRPNPPPLPPQPFRNHTPPPVPYRGNLPPASPYQQQFDRPRASSLTTSSQQLQPATVSPRPGLLDTSLPPIQTSVLPPPPLPPNPEHARLVKHLNHLNQGHIQPSILKTREQQTEARQEREKLLNVEVQAEKEVAELTRLRDSCERNIATLRESLLNSQSVIEWTRTRLEISGDELVCAQTLVYDQ
jgi:ESCRT-I complex subunit TSG101